MKPDGAKKEHRFIPYDAKYLESCGELVKESWNLHKGLENVENMSSVYELYIRDCVDYSEYTELIVDKDERVMGIMFASIENRNISQYMALIARRLKTALWRAIRLFRGDFGKITTAIGAYAAEKENDKIGELNSDNFSSELNLFIVSKLMRGRGYGYELMNRYVEFCCDNHIESAFLWTDLGCTYSFYERYGFELYGTFHSPTLTDGDKGVENGMIYWYKMENSNK